MNKPILTICIATYNRADFIAETLRSITNQLNTYVEVLIVDGNSTDNTKDIVKKFSADPRVRYINLGVKGGIDKDYCKAVEFAKGDYCWLFSDDDIMHPGAIDQVISYCKSGYSLIVLNSKLLDKKLTKEILDKLILIRKDKIFNSRDLSLLFQCCIGYMSFIGCVVIDRRLWMRREKNSYFGTEFIHLGIIFQDFLPKKALVVAKPMISIRYGNAQWSKRAFEIGIIKWPKLIKSFDLIHPKDQELYGSISLLRLFQSAVIFRAKDQYSFREYKNLISGSKFPEYWKIVLLILSFIPTLLLKVLLIVFLKSIRSNKKVLLFDLLQCLKSQLFFKM